MQDLRRRSSLIQTTNEASLKSYHLQGRPVHLIQLDEEKVDSGWRVLLRRTTKSPWRLWDENLEITYTSAQKYATMQIRQQSRSKWQRKGERFELWNNWEKLLTRQTYFASQSRCWSTSSFVTIPDAGLLSSFLDPSLAYSASGCPLYTRSFSLTYHLSSSPALPRGRATRALSADMVAAFTCAYTPIPCVFAWYF